MAVVVHTTGVNVEGLIANVASVTIIIAALGAVVTRQVRVTIRDQIRKVISEEVNPQFAKIELRLDKLTEESEGVRMRVARLEGVAEGRAVTIAAAEQAATLAATPKPRAPRR